MAEDSAPPNFSTKKTEHVKVRATYAYYSENSYELSFETNDVIEVINKFEDDQSYDGWWSGKLHGRIGLFPVAYTVEIPVAKALKVAEGKATSSIKALQLKCGFKRYVPAASESARSDESDPSSPTAQDLLPSPAPAAAAAATTSTVPASADHAPSAVTTPAPVAVPVAAAAPQQTKPPEAQTPTVTVPAITPAAPTAATPAATPAVTTTAAAPAPAAKAAAAPATSVVAPMPANLPPLAGAGPPPPPPANFTPRSQARPVSVAVVTTQTAAAPKDAAIAELEKDMLNLKKNIQMSKAEEEKNREQKRVALRNSLKPEMAMWDGSLSAAKGALSKLLARGSSAGAEEAVFLETNAKLLQEAVALGTPDVGLFVLERLMVHLIQHGTEAPATGAPAPAGDSVSKEQNTKLLDENKRQLARIHQLEKEVVAANAKQDNNVKQIKDLQRQVNSMGRQLEAEVRERMEKEDGFKHEIATLQSQVQAASTKCVSLEEYGRETKASLDKAKAKLAARESGAATAEDQMAASQAKMKEQLAIAKRRITELETELEPARAYVSAGWREKFEVLMKEKDTTVRQLRAQLKDCVEKLVASDMQAKEREASFNLKISRLTHMLEMAAKGMPAGGAPRPAPKPPANVPLPPAGGPTFPAPGTPGGPPPAPGTPNQAATLVRRLSTPPPMAAPPVPDHNKPTPPAHVPLNMPGVPPGTVFIDSMTLKPDDKKSGHERKKSGGLGSIFGVKHDETDKAKDKEREKEKEKEREKEKEKEKKEKQEKEKKEKEDKQKEKQKEKEIESKAKALPDDLHTLKKQVAWLEQTLKEEKEFRMKKEASLQEQIQMVTLDKNKLVEMNRSLMVQMNQLLSKPK